MSTEPMVENALEPMAPATIRWAGVDFSGTTLECFRHFMAAHQGRDDRIAFGLLVGTNEPATRRWWQDHCMPIGLRLLRIRFVLEWYGYTITDYLATDPTTAQFAKAVAYGLLHPKDARELLDIQEDQLRRVLAGRVGTSAAAAEMIRAYVDENSQALSEFEAKIFGERPVRAVKKRSAEVGGLTKSDTLATGAHLVTALLPLAQAILSDDFSPEEREEFRTRAGKYSVFHLKNALVRLCGERARRVHEDGDAE